MAKTVIGLFDNFSDAQSVVNDLQSAGFDRDDISVVRSNASGGTSTTKGGSTAENAGEGALAGAGTGAVVGGLAGLAALAIPGIGPALGMGWLATTLTGAAIGAGAGGLIGALTGAGVPEDDARLYEEGVRRGGTLVSVRADDEDADRAIAIFNRHNPIDIDTRRSQWTTSGATTGAAATATATATTRGAAPAAASGRAERLEADTQRAIPVVEEELQVGKREVQKGGIRVFTRVQEKPVEAQVNLREERAVVERHAVDRPATEADFNKAFQAGTIEVTERSEVPVVQKQARVVEEVIVGKEATEHTETVRDTVRRTDVQVERADWETYDKDFRTNFQSTFRGGEYTYDQALPAYRYGYDLARTGGTTGGDWTAVESDARTRWERQNPGTWEKFKDAARYAYDRARSKVS